MSDSSGQSMIDYFIDLKNGKAKPVWCFGIYPNQHKGTERTVFVGRYFYSHTCPVCGFGGSGGLSEEDYERYHSSSTTIIEEEDHGLETPAFSILCQATKTEEEK